MNAAAVDVTLQCVAEGHAVPPAREFRAWAAAALGARRDAPAALTVRIVDAPEMAALNRAYREREGETNVLSFPFDRAAQAALNLPPGACPEAQALLGDVVLCAPVVAREAAEQGKAARAHWAHLTVHGVLHLLGYDHHNDAQAAEMEALERATLHSLGFADPYA